MINKYVKMLNFNSNWENKNYKEVLVLIFLIIYMLYVDKYFELKSIKGNCRFLYIVVVN